MNKHTGRWVLLLVHSAVHSGWNRGGGGGGEGRAQRGHPFTRIHLYMHIVIHTCTDLDEGQVRCDRRGGGIHRSGDDGRGYDDLIGSGSVPHIMRIVRFVDL